MTDKKWEVGASVRCEIGRWEGHEGVITYFNPDAHDDEFCMIVSGTHERVNPQNWTLC